LGSFALLVSIQRGAAKKAKEERGTPKRPTNNQPTRKQNKKRCLEW